MILNKQQLNWCTQHTKREIMEHFDISIATTNRWLKINNIKSLRQVGSGLSNSRLIEPTPCKNCGKPTKNSWYCSRQCTDTCKIRRKKLANMDKSYMQTEEYLNTLRKDTTAAYKRYSGEVHRETRKVYEKNKDTINPSNHMRTLCGVGNGYQLDHIVPIKFGFENNIPIEEMSRVENLRMLPWKQNLERNWKK